MNADLDEARRRLDKTVAEKRDRIWFLADAMERELRDRRAYEGDEITTAQCAEVFAATHPTGRTMKGTSRKPFSYTERR